MKFGKTELIRRLTDVVRKGWTNVHVRDLIESLWRDPYSMRTSGFVTEGGPDADIDIAVESTSTGYSLTFTIAPVTKKFHFYYFREVLSYHKKYSAETISFDLQEGLYAIYYDFDEETLQQTLHYLHNPSDDELIELFEWVVPITFIYWDAENTDVIYWGDNRHGSWWNPWMHYAWHQTFNSMRESGLEFTDLIADGDGSADEQAQFGISAGSCFHEDIHVESDGVGAPADLPVFYFKIGDIDGSGSGSETGYLPRIHDSSINSLVVDGLLCYNDPTSVGSEAVPATEGYFVMYHIFFTNCIYNPFISVMGQDEYEKVGDATLMIDSEVTAVRDMLPHQNLLHIGTLIFQTSAAYGNTYKSRIVSQAFTVWTDMSVTGDGSKTNKVRLVNDEDAPDPLKFYSTDADGEKGWHTIDPRLVAGGGQAIYMHEEDSGLAGYDQALPVPPDDATSFYEINIDDEDGETIIQEFATEPGYPGTTVIPPGPWVFESWLSCGDPAACQYTVRVFKRDLAGVETPILNFTEGINGYAYDQHYHVSVMDAVVMDATDRLVFKYCGVCVAATATRITLHIEGDVPMTNVKLPLGTYTAPEDESGSGSGEPTSIHNELDGLQGGDPLASEFYHHTEAEYADHVPPVPSYIDDIIYGLKNGEWVEIPDDGSGSGSGLPTIDKDHVIEFGFNDADIMTFWDLDISAEFAYTIIHAWLRTDTGTLTGVNVKINSTAVAGIDSESVTGTAAKFTATADNYVTIGDKVTLNITPGAPTYIGGHLYIERD